MSESPLFLPDPARPDTPGSPDLAAVRARLADALTRHVDARRPDTAVPGLLLYRCDTPTAATDEVYEPSVTMNVAGSKRTVIGSTDVVWPAGRFLVTPVEVPVVSQLTAATPEHPYLAVILRLDRALIAEVLAETRQGPDLPTASDPTGTMDLGLTAAVTRLVELLDTPDDIRPLHPLIHREIVYRLLTSDRADRVRAFVGYGHTGSPVARAARWLREHPTEPLVIADLARRLAISRSALHHQFKALTGMSPGQYHKKLRLARARQLMAMDGRTAGEASRAVGYASPAHFNRDYRRLYGVPPGHDARRLRHPPPASAAPPPSPARPAARARQPSSGA